MPQLNAISSRAAPRLRLTIASIGVFALTLALAAAAIGRYQQLLERERLEATARSSERLLFALHGELQAADVLLRSVQALFLASREVTAEEFERSYHVLRLRERFAGLQAMAVALKDRREPGSGYRTDLIAPRDGNESLVGLDPASQPNNLLAVERARDLDQPVMSGSFQLVQDRGRIDAQPGVVIRVPAYSAGPVPTSLEQRRQREIGSIAISFRVSELIHAGLGELPGTGFRVQVRDISDAEPTLLYDSAPNGTERLRPQVEPARGHLEFGGRVWEMSLWPSAIAGSAPISLLLAWSAALLLSTMVAALFRVTVSRRADALALAESMTRRYRDSEARFRALNEVLPVAVVLSDAGDGRLEYVNQSGRRLLALGSSAPSTHRMSDFADGDTGPGVSPDATAEQTPLACARPLRRNDGHRFWAQLIEHELDWDGRPMRLTVMSDVSELREMTERLGHQARHDSLTGLINRREFERRLDQALTTPGGSGLLYIDLDQFKLINDVSGHLAGDALLAQLGGVLQCALGPQDQIARLGGDEFGALIASGDRERVADTAERLRRAVDAFVFAWEGKHYPITASIGAVVLDSEHPRGRRELLSLADTACYMAKEAGRNRVHLFSKDDIATSRRLREMEWVGRLRLAIAENRLCLYYQELQPLKPTRGQQGVHFELLVRLRDEDGELVPPGAFVPAAERFGLMPLLDRWVVTTALDNFSTLHPAGDDVAMCAINLSATTMEDETFPAFVLDRLKRSGVPAERLCFEVTETAAVANMAQMVALIRQLRALGCRFALDDFGAGMSSFGYLKELPVDFIKIDGSFIREIETDPMSYSIVRAVTDLGHQMGAEVIAEFVNSNRTCHLLRGLGVDYAQGFLIHQPQPAGAGTSLAA